MNSLFGLPTNALMWVFGVAFIVLVFAVIALALRQRMLLKLSMRGMSRRRGRATLIILGLMLGTAMITAAMSTGDTMTHTIRSALVSSLGEVDEIISGQEESDIELTGETAELQYFDESAFVEVQRAAAGSPLVDAVAPLILEVVAVQNLTELQNEPRVVLFATDPQYMSGFRDVRRASDGSIVSLADLGPNELYLNEEGAKELEASAGDELRLFASGHVETFRVREVVRYEWAGGLSELAALMPLKTAQRLLGEEGKIKHVIVSNEGGTISGARHSDAVVELLQPTLDRLDLAVETTKRDDLELADETGAAFASFFVIFGTFTIAAGILLIFLIFVMLAAERRSEMGISRAIGAQRSHLVQMFLFEGLAYDLLAAVVGAAFGVAIAFAMVAAMAKALAGSFPLDVVFAVKLRSLIVSFTLGVLLTLVVVTFSAWRVSVLNIVTAIRNLPDIGHRKGGRALLILGVVGVLFGALLALMGIASKQATPFSLGVSFVIIGFVPALRWLGLSDRASFSVPGLLLVVWWLLPFDWMSWFLPEMAMDFSIFILSGLMVVTGTTWVVMYNADRMLGLVLRFAGKVRWLGPPLRTAVSYPLANRFRTGVTLAMFTLVVFTLVSGGTTISAFTEAFNDEQQYGGGFQVHATTLRSNPVEDLTAVVRGTPGLSEPVEVVANQSTALIEARQSDTERGFEAYPLRGFDESFLDANTYELGAIAKGYGSAAEVWQAIRDQPGLAVVDAFAAPHRENFSFSGAMPEFGLEGFYIEDGSFDPITVEVRDAATGRETKLTVIGVLKDVAPLFMFGLSTSQSVVESAFPEQAVQTTHLFQLRSGADANAVAAELESTFFANGLEAETMREELDDLVGANRSMNYIMQGFMGLGLVVGVAALAVISARSVVERRQEIGVMRAIGFEAGRVQLSFLLESSLVALMGIVLGTGLALIVALNVIRDASTQPSWDNIRFSVPWLNLAVIFAIVYGAALLTAYLPARQAARVYPAEALRYE